MADQVEPSKGRITTERMRELLDSLPIRPRMVDHGAPGPAPDGLVHYAPIKARDYYKDAYEEVLREHMASQMVKPPAPMVMHKPLEEIADSALIMEMIKRGYACMKLPENGLPETLK